MWRCHQLLSGFLAKGHLPRVSRQWPMIRVIMKWSRRQCTDLLAFALGWGKPRKTSDGRTSDEGAVRPVIASNEIAYLQMRSVGLHNTSGREKEEKDWEREPCLPSSCSSRYVHQKVHTKWTWISIILRSPNSSDVRVTSNLKLSSCCQFSFISVISYSVLENKACKCFISPVCRSTWDSFKTLVDGSQNL